MTLFSKIINGDIPSYKVYEDDLNFAFLDINPIQPGHTLVVPKREIDYVFDLDDEIYGSLWLACKKIAHAIKMATGRNRIGVKIIGLEVPHAHVHLIPIDGLSDIDNKNARKCSEDELMEIAENIRGYL